MNDRRPWLEQEDLAIIQLVKRYGTKRWALVSQKLIEIYGLKGRTGKQCRQRYHNHLDKQISKKPWTEEQEKIILLYHKKYGNKWSQITKHLQGRTDNSIKNHFYSFLRRSLRRINKVIGAKNSTIQIKDIKPAVLSQIFAYADKEQIMNMNQQQIKYIRIYITEVILQFANFKPLKQKALQLSISQQNQNKFKQIIKYIKQFNDKYEQSKQVQIQQKQKNKYKDKNQIKQPKSEIQIEDIKVQNINQDLQIKQQQRVTRSQAQAMKQSITTDLKQTENKQKIQQQQQKTIKQEDNLSIKFLDNYSNYSWNLKSGSISSNKNSHFCLQPLYDLKDIFHDNHSQIKLFDAKSRDSGSPFSFFTNTPIDYTYNRMNSPSPMTPMSIPYLRSSNNITFNQQDLNKRLSNLKNSVNGFNKVNQNPELKKEQTIVKKEDMTIKN